MLKGEFKTAYLQREIPLRVAVVSATKLVVGELVTLTAEADGKPAYIASATSLATATHIIAQSDTTLEYGHVPVEYHDYRYSDDVKPTVASAAAVTTTTETKKVAMFQIINKDDIIVREV